MQMDEPKYMRVSQVAARWGISRKTVDRLIEKGEISCFKPAGGMKLIPIKDMLRYEELCINEALWQNSEQNIDYEKSEDESTGKSTSPKVVRLNGSLQAQKRKLMLAGS